MPPHQPLIRIHQPRPGPVEHLVAIHHRHLPRADRTAVAPPRLAARAHSVITIASASFTPHGHTISASGRIATSSSSGHAPTSPARRAQACGPAAAPESSSATVGFSECLPPARSINCGVQCPPTNSGSVHSRNATSGPSRYGFTKSAARHIRSRSPHHRRHRLFLEPRLPPHLPTHHPAHPPPHAGPGSRSAAEVPPPPSAPSPGQSNTRGTGPASESTSGRSCFSRSASSVYSDPAVSSCSLTSRSTSAGACPRRDSLAPSARLHPRSRRG